MFNFIISADEEAWDRPGFVLPADRFLEYTDDELKKRFQALDENAKKTLCSLPTLFAYESPSAKPARLGRLASIELREGKIQITPVFDSVTVDPGRVPVVAWHSFEMTRTHWAVKDGDLYEALAGTSSAVAPEPAATPAEEPTYSFSRQTLLNACDMFPTLGHSGFDRFLLEVGIQRLNAGRDRGGLSARATALAEFVLKNSRVRTAEGEPVQLAIVRKAVELDPEYPNGTVYNVAPRSREAFRKALERDGYTVRDGQIVSVVASATPSGPPVEAPSRGSSSAPSAVSLFASATAQALESVTAMLPSFPNSTRIFLVHGRDDGAKYEVAHFIQQLGLEPVILHERPNSGRTLITKFQEESTDVGFAVVLMTPDDVGGGKDQLPATEPRCRQNVVFELGFFVGKLGPKRVCALVSGTVKRPSDFDGVVYVPFGPGTPWRTDLARELRAAGVPFDPAKVLGSA